MQWLLWRQTCLWQSKKRGVDPIKTHVIFYIILLITALFSSFPVALGNPDEITKSPTANAGQWSFPTRAYTSGNNYSIAVRGEDLHEYYNYNFEDDIPEGYNIDEVLMGLEHYESYLTYCIKVRVSWDNGVSWSDYAIVASTTETMDWLNATDVTDWSRDKLTNANFRIEITYYIYGGGCYPNSTFLLVYEDNKYSLKNPESINIGETVLVWNEEKGVHHSNVTQIDVQNGNFTLYDLYSGNMTFQTPRGVILWEKHLTVTGMQTFYDPIRNVRRVANTFQVNDTFAHLNKGELIYLPIDKINILNFTGNVYNVIVDEKDACIFVKSFNETELEILNRLPMWRFVGDMNNIAMAVKMPFTAYLDWLPVKVTFSVGVAPVCIPCLFVGLCFVIGIMVLVIVLTNEKR